MANYYHNQPGPQEPSSYPSTPAVPPTNVDFYPPHDIPPLQPYPGTLILNTFGIDCYAS